MVGRICHMAALVLILAATPVLGQEVASQDLFIEAELIPADPYVQARTLYRVRLYRASSLLQGYFITPEIDHMVSEFLAEDDPVEVQRDGRRFQMIELRYALFPQKSGELTAPGLAYSGRQVFARGRPLTLKVRPRPPEAGDGWWIPAQDLKLSEKWTVPEEPFRVGGQFERTITLDVDGLTGAQLPPAPLPDVPGLKAHRAGADVTTRLDNERIRGQRVERHLYVPVAAGSFELPAIRIGWWDLATGSRRRAALEARTITVGPAASSSPVGPKVGMPVPLAQTSDDASPRIEVWIWPVAAVLLGLWVLYRVLSYDWWLRRRRLKDALRRLEVACGDNDPVSAHGALLDVGRLRFGPVTLGEMIRRLGDEGAGRALWELEAAVYGKRPGDWDGSALAQRVMPVLRRKAATPRRSTNLALPPLNPRTDINI